MQITQVEYDSFRIQQNTTIRDRGLEAVKANVIALWEAGFSVESIAKRTYHGSTDFNAIPDNNFDGDKSSRQRAIERFQGWTEQVERWIREVTENE